MNHTAHCLLSYPDTDVLIGNFIGDYVKGRAWEAYLPKVQRGILLHRAIDAFTDNHAAVRESVARIRLYAKRYAAPVVDILYDHLLCRQWEKYAPIHFEEFADWAYESLDNHSDLMPAPLQRRWPQMRDGRFLDGYRSRSGLEWVLGMFSRRLPEGLPLDTLIPFFFNEIDAFSEKFDQFFPEMKEEVGRFLVKGLEGFG